MLLKTIDQKIRQSFSNSATQYEALSGLQKEIGRELLQKVQDREECSAILDVGMGTGWLTHRLGLLFPEAKVTGLDFAPGMIELAKRKYDNFSVVLADARHLPFGENRFDIVASNLSYQWAGDLDQAFRECYRVLKPDGTLCTTLFARKTLQELFESLEKSWVAGEGLKTPTILPVQRLPEREKILTAVRNGEFRNVVIHEEEIKVPFDDMLTLVKWLKDTGANALPKDVYIGKEWLLRANEYYRERFPNPWGVFASFEVIGIQADK